MVIRVNISSFEKKLDSISSLCIGLQRPLRGDARGSGRGQQSLNIVVSSIALQSADGADISYELKIRISAFYEKPKVLRNYNDKYYRQLP